VRFYTFAKLRPLTREEKIRGVQADDLRAMIVLGNSAYPGGWLADPSEGEILTGECTKSEAALIQEHGFFVSAPHSRHALGVAWGLGASFWEIPLEGAVGLVHACTDKDQISSAVIGYTKSQLALVLKEKSTEKLLSLLWFAWSNLSDRQSAEHGFSEILATLLDRLGRPHRAKLLRRLLPPCRLPEIEFVRSPEWPLEIAE
jgi:hypothetical protein